MLTQRHPRMQHRPFTRLHRLFLGSLTALVTVQALRSDDGESEPLAWLLKLTTVLTLACFGAGWALWKPGPPAEERGAYRWRLFLHRLRLPAWAIERDDQSLWLVGPLGRRRQVPRRELMGATLVEQHGTVLVEWALSNGRRLTVAGHGFHAERDRLNRLGLGARPGWRTFRSRYRSPYRLAFWLSPLAVALGLTLASAMSRGADAAQSLRWERIGWVVAVMTIVLPTWLARMKELSLGEDGLVWEGGWGMRRLPREQIAWAQAEPGRLIVGTPDDRRLVIPCPGLSGPILTELAEELCRLPQALVVG